LVCSTGVSQFGGKRFKRLKRNVFQCGSRRSESGSLATFGIRRLELASQLFKTALDVTSCASKTGGWRFILLEQTSLRRGEVAMIAVIFEVMQAAGRKTDYLEHAAHLKGELERMDGFISVERFQSLTDPDKLLSLSFCRDDDAVARWRCHAGHRAAQAAGREGVFPRLSPARRFLSFATMAYPSAASRFPPTVVPSTTCRSEAGDHFGGRLPAAIDPKKPISALCGRA
jgi:heme-degrading monooxygenase HmoA